MSHPMSEFSERSRGRLLTAGIPHTPEPFAPENLPRIQYEMHGETTVDQRATEMLRKPTEAEVKQLGSEYRSDLGPHNYRTHIAFVADPAAGLHNTLNEIQTDFQVWAVAIAAARAQDGSFTGPQNTALLAPYGFLVFPSSGLSWCNFPTGQKFQFKYIANIGVPVSGAGWNVWLYDRWITQPGSFS